MAAAFRSVAVKRYLSLFDIFKAGSARWVNVEKRLRASPTSAKRNDRCSRSELNRLVSNSEDGLSSLSVRLVVWWITTNLVRRFLVECQTWWISVTLLHWRCVDIQINLWYWQYNIFRRLYLTMSTLQILNLCRDVQEISFQWLWQQSQYISSCCVSTKKYMCSSHSASKSNDWGILAFVLINQTECLSGEIIRLLIFSDLEICCSKVCQRSRLLRR